jgi:putative membrane protein
MMWWWNDGGWWAWAVMTLGMVAFWGGLIWILLTLVSRSNRPAAAVDPEQVLARRFAEGELDVDQYQQRLTVLRESAKSGAG